VSGENGYKLSILCIRRVVTFDKRHRENAAKPVMQRMATSPNQCCYFTLQNKMLAVYAATSKRTKCRKTTEAFKFAGFKSGRL